jgi:hypothetical protein
MKKVAFIGLTFHRKTKSSQFFIDILNKYYEVDIFWDFEENPEDGSSKNALHDNYDIIIYWQIMPYIVKIKNSKCQNIILIPMYDQIAVYNFDIFVKYAKYKFISFSKYLHEELLKFNLNSLYLQFFPKSNVYSDTKIIKKDKFNIFFWQRSEIITLEVIKKIIPKKQINSIVLHRVSSLNDTWYKEPTEEDIKEYNIKQTSWFETKEDFINEVNKCDIFVVPRPLEGIGMTFLEAMEMGKCILSPNLPTMNEYIIHNKNGLLFDINNLHKIDISNAMRLGNNAKKYMYNGYLEWINMESIIIEYLNKSELYNSEIFTGIDNVSKNISFSKNLNMIQTFINTNLKPNEKIVIYGAGTGAKLLISMAYDYIDFCIDNNSKLHNTRILDKEIKNLDSIKNKKQKIIISVFGREEIIYNNLIYNYNIEAKDIIILGLLN